MEIYKEFVYEIKQKIYKSQYASLKKVNKELLKLYWNIGKMIKDKQEKMRWGKSIVEKLALDLHNEFPGIKGFSSRNLWNMKNYYVAYRNNTKLQTLSAEISWSHNIVIMEKCKANEERIFYMASSKKYGWTYRVLNNQIENQLYKKILSSQTNFNKTIHKKYRNQAKLAVKDEYTFDFLELGMEHSERNLEKKLINNIREFLVELGGYFTYIGNQFRIEVGDEEYFIDLLLYHRILHSLIAIELKIGKFKPEHAGKMQFYLSVLDDKVKLPEENASIGIIICKEKNRTVVEYTLKDVNKPIGVSTYNIKKKLPQKLKKYFPKLQDYDKVLNINKK